MSTGEVGLAPAPRCLYAGPAPKPDMPMPRPGFTLTVASTEDGYIARSPDDSPASWASPEEQTLFFRDVDAADWAIMGRNTHAAADRPRRRRIVFTATPDRHGWQRETQLWLDPAGMAPDALAGAVAPVHTLAHGLILGGTRVHDWFLAAGAIDRIHLTVEPLRFGAGLAIFTGQGGRAPLDVLADAGFAVVSDQRINRIGTRYLVLTPLAQRL